MTQLTFDYVCENLSISVRVLAATRGFGQSKCIVDDPEAAVQAYPKPEGPLM